VTIFQDVTGSRFRTDHRSQGREVEAAHELPSLEAALAWARTRARHVVLVLSAGTESRRYSAGSAPPPDEPDLPSWPPPAAERRALAAARAAFIAERHLADEAFRRHLHHQAKADAGGRGGNRRPCQGATHRDARSSRTVDAVSGRRRPAQPG